MDTKESRCQATPFSTTHRHGSLHEVWRQFYFRHELEVLRAWTEQRCTPEECRAFHRRPKAERTQQRPPLPAGRPDVDVLATLIRSWTDAARQAWESGDVDKADLYYFQAREKAITLELRLRDNPPRSPRGPQLGPRTHPTLDDMMRAIRDLLQNNPIPPKREFMRKLGRHREDERRVNEWLQRYGMTYKDLCRIANQPS
jgi:hypothetical protein